MKVKVTYYQLLITDIFLAGLINGKKTGNNKLQIANIRNER